MIRWPPRAGMLAWVALAALPQEAAPPRFDDEGPLRNDVFVPVHDEAARALDAGDAAWVEGRRVEAFDAWQSALKLSSTGDTVPMAPADPRAARPWPDPDHTHDRRTEGVAYAVLRRLALVEEGARAAWRERFAPLSQAALSTAGSHEGALARVERDHPLTEAAAHAALRLAELELERGGALEALAWLERAARHAPADQAQRWSAALARRREVATALSNEAPPESGSRGPSGPAGPVAPLWARARALEPLSAWRIEGRIAAPRPNEPPPMGRNVAAGMAFLDDGSIVVQGVVLLLRIARDGAVARFPIAKVLGTDERAYAFASPSSGGWPLLPATDGRRVALVAGRRSELGGNALACLAFDRQGIPRVAWVVDPPVLRVAGEERACALGPGQWDFQPGPVLAGGTLVVLARQFPEPGPEPEQPDERLWLLGFELATGELAWRHFCTPPSDLRADAGGRFVRGGTIPTPAQPLARAGTRVLAGTNVGLGLLVDAVDGRVAWTLRNRRRPAEERGWPGSRRPLPLEDEPAARAWAPFDGDVLYLLRAAPDLAGLGVFLEPPRRVQGALDLLAASRGATLVLAEGGARAALLEARVGEEDAWSLFLGRDERLTGAGIASRQRALFATERGLYLFDRERGNALLAVAPLSDEGAGRGGDVLARGDRVYVLGADTLWTFRALP